MHKYIALDVESTGVDFCSSQVIEVGVVFLDDSLQPVDRREWRIKYKEDKFSWSDEAAKVHGISKEEALSSGLEPEIFLKEFEQEIIKRYGLNASHNLHIIAANAYFDYLMLCLLWNTYRKEELPLSRRLVDLTSLAFLILGNAGMTTILEELGISSVDAKRHSALYDAELHLKIFHSLATVAKQEGISMV